MVDTGVFCSQADMLQKAGAGVSSLLTAAVDTTFAYSNHFITEAESFINTTSKKNWSDVYASLNVDVKGILREAASCLSAMYAIQFDMSGYTNISEAQTMLDVLQYRLNECIKLLSEQQNVAYVTGA